MPPDNQADKLKKAREALAGPGRIIRDIRPPGEKKAPEVNLPPAELEKRRALARTSLEGYDRRQRREAKERHLAEQVAAKQKLAQDLEIKRRAALEMEVTKKKQEAEAAAAKTAAEKRRLDQVARSEKMIENIKKDPSLSLKAVRTYQTDLAASVHGGSTINTIAREGRVMMDKLAQNDPAIKKKRAIILGTLTLVLLGSAIGLGAWYLAIRGPVSVDLPPITVTSLIPAEENLELYLTGKNSLILREEVQQQRAKAESNYAVARAGGGPIANIYPTEALEVDENSGEATSKTVVGLTRYLSALDLALPFDFKLALSDNFMFGLYEAPTPALFYIFTINSYERAGTTLGQSGSQVADSLFSPLVNNLDFTRQLRDLDFTPEVISNVDVMVMRTPEGKVIMLYAFLNDKTLVMTESEETFEKILGLFRTPLPVRR